MSDKIILAVAALGLAVIQFLYRIWDKGDTEKIINEIRQERIQTKTAVGKIIDDLKPHRERGRHTESLLKELKNAHETSVNTIIELYKESIKIAQQNANNQTGIIRIIERIERSTAGHAKTCRDQFGALDKAIALMNQNHKEE